MVLAPHAIVGAATAIVFRKHPIIGLCAAFISHFALDAVPHWAYKLHSVKKDHSQPLGYRFVPGTGFLKDVFKTGADFSIGLAAALAVCDVFFPNYLWLAFLGACVGTLPDFLSLVYFLFPNPPLFYLYRFHIKIHVPEKHHVLENKPAVGIACQVAFSLAIILTLILIQPMVR
jgi:hypothetical protein